MFPFWSQWVLLGLWSGTFLLSHLWEEVVRWEVGQVGGQWVAWLGQAASNLLLSISISISIISIGICIIFSINISDIKLGTERDLPPLPPSLLYSAYIVSASSLTQHQDQIYQISFCLHAICQCPTKSVRRAVNKVVVLKLNFYS